eukprot:gene24227-1543_t
MTLDKHGKWYHSRGYWESLTLMRKLFMVGVVVFIRNPNIQLYLAMWVLTLMLLLTLKFKPFIET